ncbi:IS200/IS605 family transposase [Neobacillus ginsengisoli]|uniref:Transposase n=1 Tax=Neobacillus ginsengisoli TaxID=904295 RepID=A0ABT9Y0U9_9BACI|nr:IS200/IS605 family transposase [Neobacillus ginsengisoli]MDQ0201455.1 putative transposase [Neobacillus ginsengisoli]
MKKQQYSTIKSQVYKLNYHFVFCTRYRRKVLVDRVKDRLENILIQFSSEQGWEIINLEVKQDYCHFKISAPPNLSPSDIVAKIKRVTSRALRHEFEHLHHLPSLWTRAFFVSTDPFLSSSLIQEYIQEQKTRG